jgi:hypothetical protein
MLIYTAHRKPEFLREEETGNGFVFVKDGFSWPALLIPFFWLIWHRMWWALAGYVIAVACLAGIGYAAGFPESLGTWLGLLVNFYMGLEGNNLRRKVLSRRGYQEVADVAANDGEEAALRLFADRAAGGAG